MGKLFHKILARRLECYLRLNNIVDTSVQKGFLSKISGVMEHIFTLRSIIEDAQREEKPLFFALLDFKNAFGSVHHSYINLILRHYNIPSPLTNYIRNLYGGLKAQVKTKNWCTPYFEVRRGVFQSDTLSPLIFLLAINPVLVALQSPNIPGYHLNIRVPRSEGLPQPDNHLFVKWEEDNGEEPGWYHCKVLRYFADGTCQLLYRNSDTERLVLNNAEWQLAWKKEKLFYPLETPPPYRPLPSVRRQLHYPKFVSSSEHRAKGYADDILITTTSVNALKDTLQLADNHCTSIGLELRPDKCAVYSKPGKRVSHSTQFELRGTLIPNIALTPNKYLGAWLSTNPSTAGKDLANNFSSMLRNINDRPIRGEYKLWIYRNYLLPSLQFYLAVNQISKSKLLSLQAQANKYLKRWLSLSNSTTLAILFHPELLDVTPLTEVEQKSKISFLTSLMSSPDPLIQELVVKNEDSVFPAQSMPSLFQSVVTRVKSALETSQQIPAKTLKKQLFSSLKVSREGEFTSHLEGLEVQSKLLDSIDLESSSKIWKRIMHGLPARQMSFILRAATDTLPTPLNLARWRIQVDPKCPLCGNPCPTTAHVLNGCQRALEQGRFSWRHDCILACIAATQEALHSSNHHFLDLPGKLASENPPSTIPNNLCYTTLKPDIVILTDSQLRVVELTVPMNSLPNILAAKERKQQKQSYNSLFSDILAAGKLSSITYSTLEIGSLGHYLPADAHHSMELLFPEQHSKWHRNFLDHLSKIAINCSYHIFNCRRLPTWTCPDLHFTPFVCV